MSRPEYRWRQLTPKQRAELLAWRKARGHPWHSPPHCPNFGHLRFHVTAACFEHQPYIGHSLERMDAFARDLLAVFAAHASQTFAWCVVPNHYHALVEAPDILGLLRELGRLHGRTSHAWNGEENSRGRKVFFRAVERAMRSDRHYWASQSGASRLRRALDGLALEQCAGIPGADRPGRSETYLARIPDQKLWQGMG
jgi:putative transposase